MGIVRQYPKEGDFDYPDGLMVKDFKHKMTAKEIEENKKLKDFLDRTIPITDYEEIETKPLT